MRAFIVMALAMGAIFASLLTLTAHAQTPPADIAPRAPSDLLVLAGGLVSWTDNSDNELGFRLTYAVGSASPFQHEFELPANTTSFTLPQDVPLVCDAGNNVRSASVVAYNASGASEPDRVGIVVECESPPQPSAQPSLPGVGHGAQENTSVGLAGVSIAVAASGLAAVLFGRRTRNRA